MKSIEKLQSIIKAIIGLIVGMIGVVIVLVIHVKNTGVDKMKMLQDWFNKGEELFNNKILGNKVQEKNNEELLANDSLQRTNKLNKEVSSQKKSSADSTNDNNSETVSVKDENRIKGSSIRQLLLPTSQTVNFKVSSNIEVSKHNAEVISFLALAPSGNKYRDHGLWLKKQFEKMPEDRQTRLIEEVIKTSIKNILEDVRVVFQAVLNFYESKSKEENRVLFNKVIPLTIVEEGTSDPIEKALNELMYFHENNQYSYKISSLLIAYWINAMEIVRRKYELFEYREVRDKFIKIDKDISECVEFEFENHSLHNNIIDYKSLHEKFESIIEEYELDNSLDIGITILKDLSEFTNQELLIVRKEALQEKKETLQARENKFKALDSLLQSRLENLRGKEEYIKGEIKIAGYQLKNNEINQEKYEEIIGICNNALDKLPEEERNLKEKIEKIRQKWKKFQYEREEAEKQIEEKLKEIQYLEHLNDKQLSLARENNNKDTSCYENSMKDDSPAAILDRLTQLIDNKKEWYKFEDTILINEFKKMENKIFKAHKEAINSTSKSLKNKNLYKETLLMLVIVALDGKKEEFADYVMINYIWEKFKPIYNEDLIKLALSREYYPLIAFLLFNAKDLNKILSNIGINEEKQLQIEHMITTLHNLSTTCENDLSEVYKTAIKENWYITKPRISSLNSSPSEIRTKIDRERMEKQNNIKEASV